MTEINITIRRSDLEEIYRVKDEYKIWFGNRTKRQSWYLTVAFLLYPYYFYRSIGQNDKTVIVMLTLLMGVIVYEFIRVVRPLVAGRKKIEKFISFAVNLKVIKVFYSRDVFRHVQDDQELVYEWGDIKAAQIFDKGITLSTETMGIILPKKGMLSEEFEGLAEMIEQQVEQIEKGVLQ